MFSTYNNKPATDQTVENLLTRLNIAYCRFGRNAAVIIFECSLTKMYIVTPILKKLYTNQ